MRSTALSLRNSLGLRIYAGRRKDLLQIDGLEVKRRETAEKLRRVLLSRRWAVTPSSAGNSHNVGIDAIDLLTSHIINKKTKKKYFLLICLHKLLRSVSNLKAKRM